MSEVDILEYDQVDPQQALALNLFGLSYFLDRRLVEDMRATEDRLAPFVALYAVENGTVLGQVGVMRVTLETTSGPETFGALWAVTTRPDRTRQGVASRLIGEAHERMREWNLRYSLLTTSRSLVAHALYVKHGYRDLLAFKQALAPPLGQTLVGPALPQEEWDLAALAAAEPGENGQAAGADLALIHNLYSASVRGRLGFVHRSPSTVKGAIAAGDLSLGNILVFRRRGHPAGYAIIEQEARVARVREMRLALEDDAAARAALLAVRVAFADKTVLVRVSEPWPTRALSEAGFTSGTEGPGVLMVADILSRDDPGGGDGAEGAGGPGSQSSRGGRACEARHETTDVVARLRETLGIDRGLFVFGGLDST